METRRLRQLSGGARIILVSVIFFVDTGRVGSLAIPADCCQIQRGAMQPVVHTMKACPRVVVWLQVHGWDVAYSAIESVKNKT